MKKVEHDDFCPCARFRTSLEFCTCKAYSAAKTQEIVDEVSTDFADSLREIMTPTPAPRQGGIE